MLSPSKALKLYYLATFLIGAGLTVPLAHWVITDDVGIRGAALSILSINVLFIMIMPMVMDYFESRYFKARFIALEELAQDNPDLKAVLDEQCARLALPGLKLAIIEGDQSPLFSYGLWRNNPRLFLSSKAMSGESIAREMAPSIEAELSRFARQDHTLVFLMFAGFQVMLQNLIVWMINTKMIG